MTLRTGRLTLRPARPDDAVAMHAILRDPVAMRYWSTPPHETLDQTRDWLARMIGAGADEAHEFVAVHEGAVIGKAGIFGAGEIGFIFHQGVWGRGLATEALAAVIPSAFARLAIGSITADVDPRNGASLRVLHNAGFAVTGRAERTFQICGEWCGSVYLSRPRQTLAG